MELIPHSTKLLTLLKEGIGRLDDSESPKSVLEDLLASLVALSSSLRSSDSSADGEPPERWKTAGPEGLQISDRGNFRRVVNGEATPMEYSETPKGKRYVEDNNGHQYWAHYLMWTAFRGKYGGKAVGFKDRNPANCTLDNLCLEERPKYFDN